MPAYEDVYYESRFQAINTHVIINVTPFEERDHKQFVMQSFRELDTNIDPVEEFEGIKLLMGLEVNNQSLFLCSTSKLDVNHSKISSFCRKMLTLMIPSTSMWVAKDRCI